MGQRRGESTFATGTLDERVEEEDDAGDGGAAWEVGGGGGVGEASELLRTRASGEVTGCEGGSWVFGGWEGGPRGRGPRGGGGGPRGGGGGMLGRRPGRPGALPGVFLHLYWC